MCRSMKAAVAYFALVFGTGFILGAIRVPFLVPRWGERTAELVETPIMLVVVFFAARFVVRRFSLPERWAERVTVGVTALALMLIAEVLLAASLQDRSLREYIASRDPVSGTAYLIALALFAGMPSILMIAGRRR